MVGMVSALGSSSGLSALVVEPVADLGKQLLAVILLVVVLRGGGGVVRLSVGLVRRAERRRALGDGRARRRGWLAAQTLSRAGTKQLGLLAWFKEVVDDLFSRRVGDLDGWTNGLAVCSRLQVEQKAAYPLVTRLPEELLLRLLP